MHIHQQDVLLFDFLKTKVVIVNKTIYYASGKY